jgi:hypothetical protein
MRQNVSDTRHSIIWRIIPAPHTVLRADSPLAESIQVRHCLSEVDIQSVRREAMMN